MFMSLRDTGSLNGGYLWVDLGTLTMFQFHKSNICFITLFYNLYMIYIYIS